MNISDLRKNLSQLTKQVNKSKEEIIIIQDSRAVAKIVPYDESKSDRFNEWKKKFDKLILEGKNLIDYEL